MFLLASSNILYDEHSPGSTTAAVVVEVVDVEVVEVVDVEVVEFAVEVAGDGVVVMGGGAWVVGVTKGL